MAKTVLYFCAGVTATTAEAAEIARLNGDAGLIVHVRNALADYSQGSATLEGGDAIAGTPPQAFIDAIGVSAGQYADYRKYGQGAPAEMDLFAPGGATFAHTVTAQLCCIGRNPDGTVTDLTKAAGMAYTSSDTGKATVDANGLVTGVAAGAATITATYTFTTGKTKTATKALTLS